MEDGFRLVILFDYLVESAAERRRAILQHAQRDFVPVIQRGDEGNLRVGGRRSIRSDGENLSCELSPRHCERSEAIQNPAAERPWIASLRSQ
jgi:hypothetical protein